MSPASALPVRYTGPAFAMRRIGINLLLLLALFPVRRSLTAFVGRKIFLSLFVSIRNVTLGQPPWYDGFQQSWYMVVGPILFVGLVQQVVLYLVLCRIPTNWSRFRRRAIAILTAFLAFWPFQWQWLRIPPGFPLHLRVTGAEYVFLNAMQCLPVVGLALLYGFLMRLPVELQVTPTQQGESREGGAGNATLDNNRRRVFARRGLAAGGLVGVLVMEGLILKLHHTSDPRGAVFWFSFLAAPIDFIAGSFVEIVYRTGYLPGETAAILYNTIITYAEIPVTLGVLGMLIGGAIDRSR